MFNPPSINIIILGGDVQEEDLDISSIFLDRQAAQLLKFVI